jgi:DNA-binding NarL/FixJ family response regulator
MIRGQIRPEPVREPVVLTDQDWEILELFANGKSHPQIAGARGNSPAAVRNSIYRIQDKLGGGQQAGSGCLGGAKRPGG